jgi:hypothetical protein
MECLKERSFRRHRRICEDDIKTDFREIVLGGYGLDLSGSG